MKSLQEKIESHEKEQHDIKQETDILKERLKEQHETVEILQETVASIEKEHHDLKLENKALKKELEAQHDTIKNLQRSPQKHAETQCDTHPDVQPSSQSVSGTTDNQQSQTHKTLLIGDSIIKDIYAKGLCDTEVICMRGKTIQDTSERLKHAKVEEFKAIIIHVGTNNCSNDASTEDAAESYNEMLDNLNSRNPESSKIISSIIPRSDSPDNQERVEELNKKLQVIADGKSNCMFLNNDKTFKTGDGNSDASMLNGSRLHLSSIGTRKLLTNFNSIHTIIKPRVNRVQDHSRISPPPLMHRYGPRRDNAVHAPHQHQREMQGQNQVRFHQSDGNSQQHFHHNQRYNSHRDVRRGCYFCGELNHQKRDCKFGKPVQCFSCGGFGHKQNSFLCH